MEKKEKILICGILPPPFFGHSAMYKILMESAFIEAFDITFLNMKFWSYGQHKKVSFVKLLKLVKYLFQYIFFIVAKRPRYVLYNMSFDKMPFLKDFLFCFIGKVCGRRIVLHDMGQYVNELYQSGGKVYRVLMRWLLNNTTACILLGERTKTVYEGLIDSRRLFSVPGSVEDTEGIASVDEEPESSQRAINILYFSFMARSKGVFTAFKAASKALSEDTSIRFTFAGPMESESVREAFNDLRGKFRARVQYLGYIGNITERTKIYRAADIFIFPTHRDVFGLVLLHAMAEGLPIVSSVEGTIPEIVQEGENGFLLNKGDYEQLAERILRLARDPSLRQKMGEANRRRYTQIYSPQEYGRKMIRAFAEIGQLG